VLEAVAVLAIAFAPTAGPRTAAPRRLVVPPAVEHYGPTQNAETHSNCSANVAISRIIFAYSVSDRGFSIMLLQYTGCTLAGLGSTLVPPSRSPHRSCSRNRILVDQHEARPDFESSQRGDSESGLGFPPRETQYCRCFASRWCSWGSVCNGVGVIFVYSLEPIMTPMTLNRAGIVDTVEAQHVCFQRLEKYAYQQVSRNGSRIEPRG
jgi:hypothetical protein